MNNLSELVYLFKIAMQAGFSLMETGLVRSKNATNILMKSTLDACKSIKFINHLNGHILSIYC